MADPTGGTLIPGPASETVVSLSQVVLAPLDAIFKSQVHAARSFLSFILQLAHKPTREGEPQQPMFHETFSYDYNDETGRKTQTLHIPTLALVPIKPLAVQEASFKLAMTVSYIGQHRQERASVRSREQGGDGEARRPWFLVDDPISLRGVVAPTPTEKSPAAGPTVEISVKVGPAEVPAALDRFLSSLGQRTVIGPWLPATAPAGGAAAGTTPATPGAATAATPAASDTPKP